MNINYVIKQINQSVLVAGKLYITSSPDTLSNINVSLAGQPFLCMGVNKKSGKLCQICNGTLQCKLCHQYYDKCQKYL